MTENQRLVGNTPSYQSLFANEDHHTNDRQPKKKPLLAVLGLIVVGVALTIGVLIGYHARGRAVSASPKAPVVQSFKSDNSEKLQKSHDVTAFDDVTRKILDGLSAENIRDNLRKLTEAPNLAGTAGERRVEKHIYDTWEKQGFDHLTTKTYNILLSYPDSEDPNQLFLLDGNDAVQYETQKTEKVLTPGDGKANTGHIYNGFSASGEVQGSLVYVNYGRIEDFQRLTQELGIDVKGHIAIVKYGVISRASKVRLAEEFGALGVIMYTDPADFTTNQQPDAVYPNSWWMPPSGIQRGSVLTAKGDVLTRGYPAIDTAYRIPVEDIDAPKIPVLPISYGDARHFLSLMQGPQVPVDWQGGLDFAYHLGPGFHNPDWKVKLHVNMHLKRVNTTDIFGFIIGSEEPDRYVLLGNHHDAWVYGAIDPESATASMLELSRVFNNMAKQGWRPRRTIVFCNWGAEEAGIIGSWEWVEDYVKILSSRAIAYLNMDMSIEGTWVPLLKGAPLLYNVLYDTAKKIPSPEGDGSSMYDNWMSKTPAKDIDGNILNVPRIKGLGASSDYAAFMAVAGVSSCDLRYTTFDNVTFNDYPLYHSAYDTFEMVDAHMDPGFKYSLAITQMWGELAHTLADTPILPLNVESYASAVQDYVVQLDRGYGALMKEQGILLDDLYKAAANLKRKAHNFSSRLNKTLQSGSVDPLTVRMYNDQMMKLERAFIDPNGLPGRPSEKHILLASSLHNSNAGDAFPGIVDLMYEIQNSDNPKELWEDLKRHLSIIIYTIDAAADILLPMSQFTGF